MENIDVKKEIMRSLGKQMYLVNKICEGKITSEIGYEILPEMIEKITDMTNMVDGSLLKQSLKEMMSNIFTLVNKACDEDTPNEVIKNLPHIVSSLNYLINYANVDENYHRSTL